MNGGATSTLKTPTRLKMLDVRKLVPVFIVFLAVTAAFAVFDVVLVRVARQHRAETGTRLFQRGREAEQAGRTADALELYRSAHNQSPTTPRYHVAFAQALHRTGRSPEAQRTLERLLSAHPAHG